jgi:hypothetical protein
MTGTLIKKDGNWVVSHIKDGDEYIYPICPKTTDWTLRKSTQLYIKEGIEVVFNLIVKGEYCETKEMLIKNYHAKIVLVNHETI